MSENGGQEEDITLTDDANDSFKMSELTMQAQSIVISLYNIRVHIKNIENQVRQYEKETFKFIRHLKKNSKTKGVKKLVDPDKKEREPSGFAKKSKVRKEFVDFLKKKEVQSIIETIMAEEELKQDSKFDTIDEEGMINRPSATKIINRYIKEKNLGVVGDKRYFRPDADLTKILLPLETVDKKENEKKPGLKGCYYQFKLQKYIKHLFLAV